METLAVVALPEPFGGLPDAPPDFFGALPEVFADFECQDPILHSVDPKERTAKQNRLLCLNPKSPNFNTDMVM